MFGGVLISAHQIIGLLFFRDSMPGVFRVDRVSRPAHLQDGDLCVAVAVLIHDPADVFHVPEGKEPLSAVLRSCATSSGDISGGAL